MPKSRKSLKWRVYSKNMPYQKCLTLKYKLPSKIPSDKKFMTNAKWKAKVI